MAKVLLVDTNFSSAPIHAALQRLGHEVHVVGGNPNDCLAKVSDHYWQQDYSNPQALARLIDDERFDFLVPGCTDISYRACCRASRGRFPGVASVDADIAINEKSRFRELAESLSLPTPQLQREGEPLRWPLIVKPVDAFSGKGITVLKRPDDGALQEAIGLARSASASGRHLIEDFVEGTLYSHSAFLSAGKVVEDHIVQEDATANPFVVDTSRVIFDPPLWMLSRLREAVEAIARHLALADGLFHTQFISDGSAVWMIECTRRCPGDLYSQLIELSVGPGYVENYVRPFLGMRVEPSTQRARNLIMRHTVSVPTPQEFLHLRFRRALQIERWVPLSLTGSQLKASPASRVGILFARGRDEPDLAGLYSATLQRNLYDLG